MFIYAFGGNIFRFGSLKTLDTFKCLVKINIVMKGNAENIFFKLKILATNTTLNNV